MQAQSYRVLGLMSGSSLDGLDIAFVALHESGGQWRYEWIATDCQPYPPAWLQRLEEAPRGTVPDFLKTHTAYGHFLGHAVLKFLNEKSPGLQPDFIASHGHTLLHEPQNKVSFQVGDGAAIAATTGLPVITDLRSLDVALGGQGAPIVPIGDRLLFGAYTFLLNLGGIANVTIQQEGLAFDICPCNQLLNPFAQELGQDFDDRGHWAQSGQASETILQSLRALSYYQQAPPKSLSNEFAPREILSQIRAAALSPHDALSTCSAHIADRIATALQPYSSPSKPTQMLVTGGGAWNDFLMEQLRAKLKPQGIELIIPEASLVQYKEALIMALIGTLRWREEVNVLRSVTGASRDSVGGALWAGKRD